MQDLMSDEEIEELAVSNGTTNGHHNGNGNDDGDGGPPSGESSEETVFEFTMTPKSGRDAIGKGLKAAKAGTKTAMATRRAIERRREIKRQARRQKAKDTLQILGLLTSFFT
jgi:hypothetical protein